MKKSVFVNVNASSKRSVSLVDPATAGSAPHSKPQRSTEQLCYRCGKPGHIRAQCPNRIKKPKKSRAFVEPAGVAPAPTADNSNKSAAGDITIHVVGEALGHNSAATASSSSANNQKPNAPPPCPSSGPIGPKDLGVIGRRPREMEDAVRQPGPMPSVLDLKEWRKKEKEKEKKCFCDSERDRREAQKMERRYRKAAQEKKELEEKEKERETREAEEKSKKPPPDDGRWWNKPEHESLAKHIASWTFSFHDFPAMWRDSQTKWAHALAFLPLIAALAVMLIWYPTLSSLWAVVLILLVSIAMTEAPLRPSVWSEFVVSTMKSGWAAFKDSRNTSIWSNAPRYWFGDVSSLHSNWAYMLVASVSLFLILSFSCLVVWVIYEYIIVIVAFANLMVNWEERLYEHIFPSFIWDLWYSIPPHARHFISWISWFKYLFLTWISGKFYARYIILSTSITTISFVCFEHEIHGHDKRQHTFRNQDLNDDACPFTLSFVRRIFGLIPIMSQTRVGSATMIMELTAHKFLNGSVELPDTTDRINRAMRGIGYLDIDATDVFRNRDQAEIARLVAISWAKYRLEANFGLRLQDF